MATDRAGTFDATGEHESETSRHQPEEAAPTQMFVVTAFAPRRGSHKKRIVVRQGNYPSMSDGSVWRFCERQRREMCAHRFHEL